MISRLALVIFLLVLCAPAPRAEALYYFNDSNQFGAWQGAMPPGYGYVDIVRGANDWIFFEVGANPDYFTSESPGLNWNKFYFNYAGDLLDPGTILVEEEGNWTVVSGRNVSTFGRFDFGLEGSGLGSAATDPLRFRIEDASLNPAAFIANDLGWLFAGHLQRFSAIDEATSNYLAVADPSTPVPEPGTLLLVGAGIGGLVLRRRRRS